MDQSQGANFPLESILDQINAKEYFAFICSTEEKCKVLQNKIFGIMQAQKKRIAICRNAESVFENLTVLENVFIHSAPIRRKRRLEQRRIYLELAAAGNVQIDPDAKVSSLSEEQKYLVELLRLTLLKPETIILSSISTVLGIGSFNSLSLLLSILKDGGTRVLIVSTRWEDTIQLCSQIAVESGLRENSYSVLRIRDIRRDPRILFYALADYEDAPNREDLIKSLNTMLDISMPQTESMELERRIIETLNTVKEQLNASSGCLYYQNERKNYYCQQGQNYNNSDYVLQPSFLRMVMENVDKISFFSKAKYHFEDIFMRVPSNISLLICHPIYAIPDKIGVMVLMFEDNVLCTNEQIITIQMCCNLLSNMLCSSYIANKDVFVEESNHRIKNNLQTIISLLFIQKQIYHSPEMPPSISVEQMDAFIESMVGRIKLISEMHNFVAKRHSNAAEISTEEIMQTVLCNYQCTEIRFDTETDYIILPYEKASIIVMILNELVCNSVKHAFSRSVDENIIRIRFRNENGEVCMKVCDNGKGIDDIAQIQNTNSLGMKIINTLSKKIGASIAFQNREGLCACLRFVK